ncbi:UbiA-like protein EboC [Dyadobacter frigoris]|uniref:Polyprenyltransferase n=1 Tax=Dyadobacter frigoris TaxID=2576211 RepID=A0A4U6D450_9BACT|nr:UbiA-like protein EboC [Dyadobacter frigoris]TKT92012.1 polyprenyltransferase [Dyadobacter frigoris]GLU53109.1 geranylgeranylglycerol-phosphate geranylgeranyltransferase [Dyadobacter frigoris]
MAELKPYLQLTRPANLVTAVADILAGMAIAQFTFSSFNPALLVVSTLGLYGGGVVMNDVFDAKLDAIERPERPIPSGKVPLKSATILGLTLLFIGILAATLFSYQSGMIAVVVAALTVLYNRFAKHHVFFGPLTMGMCRGGNLLLGMSVLPESFQQWSFVALLPIAYIAAITLISQDEVHGGKKRTLYIAVFLYLVVLTAQLLIADRQGNVLFALPFVLLHAWLIGRPLYNAIQNPIGPLIGKAVKAGVLSLIVMNASWCMAFGLWPVALAVLALLPLSILLARVFAVT